MRKIILNGLLFLSLSLLLLPGLQRFFRFVPEKDLMGVVTVSDKCCPTPDSIFSGEFQQCASVYVSNHIGFRNTLIRVNNQVAFSLFHISPEKNIVVGKDNYLYEKNYIHSYLGHDYIGRSRMVGKVKRIERFQEILKENNIDFILVFEPSKSRVLPSNMPEQFRRPASRSNYEGYLDVLSKEGRNIHFLDLNGYFMKMQDTTAFPLFPKGGTHWSNFSARRWALDTLLRFMEKVRGVRLGRLVPQKVTWSDSLQEPDEDLADLLNLLFPYPSGEMPYPSAGVDSTGAFRPNVLAIADSYFWEMYTWGKLSYIFRSTDFWVWNNVRYPKKKYNDHPSEDYLWYKQDILSHDFVLLMVTEINLPTLLEFDEKTFLLFDPTNPTLLAMQKKRAERIAYFRTLILNDKQWSDMVREKARVKHVPFEEMVDRDAKYMADQEINTQRGK